MFTHIFLKFALCLQYYLIKVFYVCRISVAVLGMWVNIIFFNVKNKKKSKTKTLKQEGNFYKAM